jgi:cellulose synthase/poly-beta-1,6-N-acetylglucosamine synthase-like glycosyltransferase
MPDLLIVWNVFSVCAGLLVGLASGYLWVIALASIRPVRIVKEARHVRRFAVAIPAHNEESVIGETVATLKKLDYPADLWDVFVAADNCTDRTAELARAAGAVCYERTSAERSGKGEALRWLFERIFQAGDYEAVVVFDADTQVRGDFLRVVNQRLEAGAQVVQGKHVISNPRQGWFPALTWAMMTIDCRLFSQGRTNLGLSARHMGDSICFRAPILRELGWGSGLAEDYELRLRLLLSGVCIEYEPGAVGYGQAPLTWQEAQAQRVRWARGVATASKAFRGQLLRKGIDSRDWRLIDGALSVSLPSYTALALISWVLLLINLLVGAAPGQAWGWGGALAGLFVYPLFGLALERAPGWAYLVILSGPVYMIWRTWINLLARLRARRIVWVRTPHRGEVK